MDTYEMLIENELLDGVFAIGIVEDPAIQTDFILLSKNDNFDVEIKLAVVQDEKRKVVCGPILIPDMIIPRKDYNIKFSSDTIRKISENFMMNGNKDNITINHDSPINKVKMIESWIVDDNTNDKSTYLGFNVPNGTWMGSYKVEDMELWNQVIETGIIKGFSIEGRFTHQKVEMKKYSIKDIDFMNVYLAVKYSKKDLDSNFIWRTAKGDENCPSCKSFNGKIKKLSEWIQTAIPGVPENMSIAGLQTKYAHSPYSTFCEDNCKCSLNKI